MGKFGRWMNIPGSVEYKEICLGSVLVCVDNRRSGKQRPNARGRGGRRRTRQVEVDRLL